MIDNLKAWGVFVYLTYYGTYLFGNLYVYSLDLFGGKGVSKFCYRA